MIKSIKQILADRKIIIQIVGRRTQRWWRWPACATILGTDLTATSGKILSGGGGLLMLMMMVITINGDDHEHGYIDDYDSDCDDFDDLWHSTGNLQTLSPGQLMSNIDAL